MNGPHISQERVMSCDHAHYFIWNTPLPSKRTNEQRFPTSCLWRVNTICPHLPNLHFQRSVAKFNAHDCYASGLSVPRCACPQKCIKRFSRYGCKTWKNFRCSSNWFQWTPMHTIESQYNLLAVTPINISYVFSFSQYLLLLVFHFSMNRVFSYLPTFALTKTYTQKMHLMLLGSALCFALVPKSAKESYSKNSISPYNCMEILIVLLFEIYMTVNYDT